MAYKKYSEKERLNAVKRFDRFDFDLNKNLHGILDLASYIYETPVAFITLIDERDQLFKVTKGFNVSLMPRETSFCHHTIMHESVMIVSDALNDERFANNPLVKNAPNIRFYAGAPLATNDGQNIGTLCLLDTVVKQIPEEKRQLLDILSKQAINIMELEVTYKLLNEKMNHIEFQNNLLVDIAFIQSHEFRGPLSTIMGLMNVIKEDEYRSPKDYLVMMETAVHKLDEKVRLVVESTEVVKKTMENGVGELGRDVEF